MLKNSPLHLALILAATLALTGREGRAAAPYAAGITEPFLDVTLSASVSGTLVKLAFKEGDFIKPGQVIMELDKKQEELEVARRKLIWESKAELNAAGYQVATLKTDLDATRKLFETTKSVSRDQLDKKELEYQQAVAEHERLASAEDREKIEYEMALEQLRRRQIVSPLAGYLTELFLEVGEDCKAQEPVARIVETRRCYFVSNVEGRAGHQLQVGQNVRLEVEAGTDAVQLAGQVVFVSPVVDPASGLLRVKVLFENPEGKIRPGVAGKMFFQE